jgi:Uma2 family endonuclease
MTSALDISFDSVDNPLVPVLPPGEDELPSEDGVPMETEQHFKQMTLLIDALETEWRDRDDFYVGGNMFLYFSETQVKKNDFRGPDVFVVLDTIRRVRKSWVVWQEERGPDVIIELLSPTTEKVDRGEKMRVYAKALHVPEYYLYDPDTHVFEGYTLDLGSLSYVRMEPEPSGDLVSRRLGLRLGVRPGRYLGVKRPWLRWLDDDGNVLRTGEEHALVAEGQARAAEEHARVAEEQARAAQEQARASKENARALAAKLAEYEKRFGKLDASE